MKIYSTCEKMNINAYFINDSCGFEYNWLGLVMAVDKSYSDLDTLSRVIDSYLVEIKPIQHPAKENAVTLYNRGLDQSPIYKRQRFIPRQYGIKYMSRYALKSKNSHFIETRFTSRYKVQIAFTIHDLLKGNIFKDPSQFADEIYLMLTSDFFNGIIDKEVKTWNKTRKIALTFLGAYSGELLIRQPRFFKTIFCNKRLFKDLGPRRELTLICLN